MYACGFAQELPPEIAARIAEAERIAAEAEAEAAAYAEHAAAIQAEHDLQQQEENLVRPCCLACRMTCFDQAHVCKILCSASIACSEQSIMCCPCVLYCCLVLYLDLFFFNVQAKGSKVQSFSKFQAELRAQQRQKQHKHKHERKDKRHKSDKHQAASAASQSSRAESHADTAQVHKSLLVCIA